MDGWGGRLGWKDGGGGWGRKMGGADNGVGRCPWQEGRGGSPDESQRALLAQLSLVESPSCVSLHTDMPVHLTGRDTEAQASAPCPRPHCGAGIRGPQRSRFWSQSFSGASWGIWMVWMPQTGSVGRGLKPVKGQVVGGQLPRGWGDGRTQKPEPGT